MITYSFPHQPSFDALGPLYIREFLELGIPLLNRNYYGLHTHIAHHDSTFVPRFVLSLSLSLIEFRYLNKGGPPTEFQLHGASRGSS